MYRQSSSFGHQDHHRLLLPRHGDSDDSSSFLRRQMLRPTNSMVPNIDAELDSIAFLFRSSQQSHPTFSSLNHFSDISTQNPQHQQLHPPSSLFLASQANPNTHAIQPLEGGLRQAMFSLQDTGNSIPMGNLAASNPSMILSSLLGSARNVSRPPLRVSSNPTVAAQPSPPPTTAATTPNSPAPAPRKVISKESSTTADADPFRWNDETSSAVTSSTSQIRNILTASLGKRQYIEGLQKDDILCGRGGKSNHHPGNQRYRRFVQEMKEKYKTMGRKGAKTDLSIAIVNHIHSNGGRFVKYDKQKDKYYILTPSEARKKTSQALRETRNPLWT
eukprot:scaffold523_cov101-Cylindrotheca_fusiformis.AAC.9